MVPKQFFVGRSRASAVAADASGQLTREIGRGAMPIAPMARSQSSEYLSYRISRRVSGEDKMM